MSLRFVLNSQLHYIGTDDGVERLITIQRWTAPRSAKRRSIQVIAHDGREIVRKVCISAVDLQHLDSMITETSRVYAGSLLSEDQARVEIRRRNPDFKDGWCNRARCGWMLPVAGGRCPDGHVQSQAAWTSRATNLTTIPFPLRTAGQSDG